MIILKCTNTSFRRCWKKYDPQTFYWPASPSSGGGFDAPNDEKQGDVHYWMYGTVTNPLRSSESFISDIFEFGFQSFPALKTVETFTPPEDRNIFSYVMEKHQRNQSANGKIMNYLGQTYLYPADFGTLLYASQLCRRRPCVMEWSISEDTEAAVWER